jgi:hypothetical protein
VTTIGGLLALRARVLARTQGDGGRRRWWGSGGFAKVGRPGRPTDAPQGTGGAATPPPEPLTASLAGRTTKIVSIKTPREW